MDNNLHTEIPTTTKKTLSAIGMMVVFYRSQFLGDYATQESSHWILQYGTAEPCIQCRTIEYFVVA